MQWGAGVAVLLLLGGLASAGDDLSGTIQGGKAKELVDKAMPMLKEADAVFKAWVFDEIPAAELLAKLEKGIELYDKGTALLQQALDIQYDGAVNHSSTIAARRLQKMRYHVEFALKRPKPKPQPGPKPAPPDDGPAHPGDGPAQPAPEDAEPEPPPPAPPPRDLTLDERPGAAVAFRANEPPAVPSDVGLRPPPLREATPELQRLEKMDRKVITERVRDYYGAFRPNKLRSRHRLCRGKGCKECNGSGQEVNLHYFRKAFWTSYTPLLRDAAGALPALQAFYDRARSDPAALGPEIKGFRVGEIEYHRLWARVAVTVTTDEGDEERTMTLIGIGSQWFLYHPESDAELLPPGMAK
jgi:hypothetical protein